MVLHRRPALPERAQARGLQFERYRPYVIGRREKHDVIDNNGRSGIDGFEGCRSEGKSMSFGARPNIKDKQAVPRKKYAEPAAVYHPNHWSRVACPVVTRFPNCLARQLIKTDDTCPIRPAEVYQHQGTFDNRSRPGAEESLRHLEFFIRGTLPD
jgi:hypothetical protein